MYSLIHSAKRLCLTPFSSVALFGFFVLFFNTTAVAQDVKSQFEKANELYRNSSYDEAIEIYESIEQTGAVSAELYYNLGNAYYKMNEVAASIYNYEKALQLNPTKNEDILTNLTYAKRMTIDVIEALPKTFLQRIESDYVQSLSFDQWAYLAVFGSFLTAICFLLFYFSFVPLRKRLYFIGSTVGLFLLIFSLSFSISQYNTTQNTSEAILFEAKVGVKSAPSQISEEVFELHEGTKVKIIDRVDVWLQIKLEDGKKGWLLNNQVKEL
ncbi:MAG: tetratricopeptide repeat protein [Flavicella sp.]